MNENYSIININTGQKICQSATLEDAKMVVGLDPANRVYRKNRFILDQIIDVTSTTDKQLPGQLGLPAAKHPLPPLQQEVLLPESEAKPINI